MVDTDVVIAALDRSDAHHAEAAAAIRAMLGDGEELMVSTVNYAEALVRPAQRGATLITAVDAIFSLDIRPIPPSAAVARDAAQHRSLGISLADGFALATAQARSASCASFDRRVRRAMAQVGIDDGLDRD